jgi:hypothetical protein
MKQLSIMIPFIMLCFFAACQKTSTDTPSDLFDGKKLEGKWFPVTTIIKLKYQNGTEQNVTVAGEPDQYLEFKYGKKVGSKSEGAYTSAYAGVVSTGKWEFQQDKGDLDITYTSTSPNIFLYRKVDELDSQKLIMSADDNMVKLYYEVNDLNVDATNKIVGGSIFEEYKR